MLHHDVAGLQRGMFYCYRDVIRTAGFQGSLVQKIDRVNRCLDRLGMGIEHYSVAARQHTDGIAEDRFTGIGAGGDRADHAEGSHLDQSKASVA